MTTEAGVGGNTLTSSSGIWPDAYISYNTAALLQAMEKNRLPVQTKVQHH